MAPITIVIILVVAIPGLMLLIASLDWSGRRDRPNDDDASEGRAPLPELLRRPLRGRSLP